MNRWMIVLGLVAAVGLAGCGKKDEPAGGTGAEAVSGGGSVTRSPKTPASPDASVALYKEGLTEAAAVARTVKDEASAKAAAPKWAEATRKMEAAANYWKTIDQTQQQANAMKLTELVPASMELGAEMQRIALNPELAKHFGEAMNKLPQMK